jgi:glucose dehydrogenase
VRDLVAFLSSQNGAEVGPLKKPAAPPTQTEIDEIAHPKNGDWPTYNGTLDGNRFSRLDEVNLSSVAKLQLQWTYSIPFNGLETTPVVVDGVMYDREQSGLCAERKNGPRDLAIRTAQERRQHHRSDAAIGVNRGVAVLGDRIFYLTDDAHLIALHRLTGAVLWDVDTPEGAKGLYGGTSAPLVVGDLVITGVSGGDNGIRGYMCCVQGGNG